MSRASTPTPREVHTAVTALSTVGVDYESRLGPGGLSGASPRALRALVDAARPYLSPQVERCGCTVVERCWHGASVERMPTAAPPSLEQSYLHLSQDARRALLDSCVTAYGAPRCLDALNALLRQELSAYHVSLVRQDLRYVQGNGGNLGSIREDRRATPRAHVERMATPQIEWNRTVGSKTRGYAEGLGWYEVEKTTVRATVYFEVTGPNGEPVGARGTLGLAKGLANEDFAKRLHAPVERATTRDRAPRLTPERAKRYLLKYGRKGIREMAAQARMNASGASRYKIDAHNPQGRALPISYDLAQELVESGAMDQAYQDSLPRLPITVVIEATPDGQGTRLQVSVLGYLREKTTPGMEFVLVEGAFSDRPFDPTLSDDQWRENIQRNLFIPPMLEAAGLGWKDGRVFREDAGEPAVRLQWVLPEPNPDKPSYRYYVATVHRGKRVQVLSGHAKQADAETALGGLHKTSNAQMGVYSRSALRTHGWDPADPYSWKS